MTTSSGNDIAITAAAMMENRGFAEAVQDLIADPDFAITVAKLDFGALGASFNDFDEHLVKYNNYHRLERRLWSLKLGNGTISPALENSLKAQVHKGRQAFKLAFGGIDRCIENFESAGFGKVLDRHLPRFLPMLGVDHHPLRSLVDGHLSRVGCSPSMLEEGHHSLAGAQYDVLGRLGGGKVKGLRKALAQSVEAQNGLFDYTEKDGLRYLRGRCGPPTWAVVATKVLAYFGLSVSAWWVVAAVTVVVALLVTLCATKALPADVLEKCKYLSIKLKFTF